MRGTRHITGTLVLAAFAATACSKPSEAPKAQANDSAQGKPVTPQGVPPIAKQTDRKPLDANETPAGAGPASFAEGEAAYRARKYGEATGIFERYVTARPDNAMGQFMLGLSAWKGNDLVKAGQAFEAALAIDPGHVKSLVNLSRVLITQKRGDEAIDRLTQASAIAPESAEVHRLLGRANHVQGRTAAAAEAYRHAIDLDKRDVWSLNNLGLLLLEQQRFDEALPLLMQAVELRKDVPAFHNNLGMALEHAGRFAAATSAYKEALMADPTYDRAKQNLARVESIREQLEDAPVVDTATGAPEAARISRLEKKPE
jgi:tetratricopeptide (TPR) repeat protein